MSEIRFEIKDYNEESRNGVLRFDYEHRIVDETNKTLLNNFFKVAKWVKDNCPKLNGIFHTEHRVYYKIDLIVEEGVAYLCYGDHSSGYAIKVSEFGTDFYVQGSCQGRPYRFEGVFGMRNDKLEEFLIQWKAIKQNVISANAKQCEVFSDDFVA